VLDLVICSALPRPERARWLVEKGAELGVRDIVFYSSIRAPRALSRAAHERLARVAAAAFTQSDGSRLTEIRGLVGWPELVAGCGVRATLLLEPGRRGRTLEEATIGGEVRVVVGPEGGLAAHEVDELLAAGAFPWRLGPRRLRVETAAIAAASRLLAH
ncbi:MAG TPA: RsmE family RNA methyltransferase, partial [Thermoanaerobaculia bacterium]|nr:RsmE family RNA methyltransferase [Thermoanaerobaculia bacterium]